jgi:hypothetical protein
MAIKFVREDFRDRAKGVRREMPPVRSPVLTLPKIRWTRFQVFSLLAIICALLILDGLQKKRHSEREQTAVVDSLVADKWTESLVDGGEARYFVELTMPYEDVESATVVAECQADVWNSLREGAPVSVSFYTEPREGILVIQSIAPIPVVEDSGALHDSGNHGED